MEADLLHEVVKLFLHGLFLSLAWFEQKELPTPVHVRVLLIFHTIWFISFAWFVPAPVHVGVLFIFCTLVWLLPGASKRTVLTPVLDNMMQQAFLAYF